MDTLGEQRAGGLEHSPQTSGGFSRWKRLGWPQNPSDARGGIFWAQTPWVREGAGGALCLGS